MVQIKPPPSSCLKVLRHKIAKTTGKVAAEPLLQANPHRFVMFPIQHNTIWRMYKKAEASFWTAEEIDLAADATDWDRLLTTEQHFILHVLTFFAASNGIVNENLSSNFATELHHRKPDASTASRSPSKTSTARRTFSSSTRTSRTPRRRCTSCERSRPSPVSSEKHSGRSDGATPLQPALPNA
jgi:hypothetical protein